MTDTSKARPKLPMGNMKVSKAKQRWEDVRKAAQSGDPAAMMDAVSRFQGIAETMLAYFENRDRLRTELDEAKASEEGALMILATERAEINALKAENERLRGGISSALDGLELISGGWVPDAVIQPIELLRLTLEGPSQ